MKKIMLILTLILLVSCEGTTEYNVKVTYCDGRAPKIIKVKTYGEPNNSSISNYKMAVPEYRGELNVCSIEVVK